MAQAAYRDEEPSDAEMRRGALMIAANDLNEDGAEEFADRHVECFMQEFAASEGSAEEWLQSVGCDGLGDADGDGQVNELLRSLTRDSLASKTFSGGYVHWQIMKKLARQAFDSGEWL